jgi:hypothetical protein
MKRFSVEESTAEEISNGEWVKYEPWMDDERVQEFISDLGIKCFGDYTHWKASFFHNEPTICVKCKHYMGPRLPGDLCNIKEKHFVYGSDIYPSCSGKNHGDCSDFEVKE